MSRKKRKTSMDRRFFGHCIVIPPASRVQFSVALRLNVEEIMKLSPQQVHAIFEGISKVVAAKQP